MIALGKERFWLTVVASVRSRGGTAERRRLTGPDVPDMKTLEGTWPNAD